MEISLAKSATRAPCRKFVTMVDSRTSDTMAGYRQANKKQT